MSLRDARVDPVGSGHADRPGAGPRILMAPDYRRDNPYQALLAGALEDLGATVSFPRGYRRVLPLRRALGQDGVRPDVLHLHWLAPYLKGRTAAAKVAYAAKLLLDLALARRVGVRLVWTVHNLVEHEQTHPRIELWCRRWIARLADVIIVHSERARELVAETCHAAAGKIAVIPHGHYRDVYGPPVQPTEARARLGLPREGRVFLFFGMIRPYKGVLRLLSAWAETPELHERHTLVVAGAAEDPVHREQVRRAAEAAPNVRLRLERVPDDEVATYLSAADVVVLSQEHSLASGSLVLAQSFARPVATLLSDDGMHERRAAATIGETGASLGLRRLLLDAMEQPVETLHRTLVSWQSIALQHASAFEGASPESRP